MTRTRRGRTAALAAAAALALVAVLGAPSALAAKDKTAPTTPTSFKVVSTTAYTATLSWGASTDNSGSVQYVLSASSTGLSVTLPAGTTSYTWKNGLVPGGTYTFSLKAVDPSGNSSKTVTAKGTMKLDTTPPATPTLSLTGLGPSHVSVSWTAAVDDGPHVFYAPSISGGAATLISAGNTATSATFADLVPGATYTVTVRSRDLWNNFSPPSNAITVTTPPRVTPDTSAPSPPGGLTDAGMTFQDGEVWLFWQSAVDDTTPTAQIVYEVYVNGVLDHEFRGGTRTILYVPVGQSSVLEVFARDQAGNRSAPATLVVTP